LLRAAVAVVIIHQQKMRAVVALAALQLQPSILQRLPTQ
jgi:hypothetical protein